MKYNRIPNVEELKEALGLIPLSSLSIIQHKYKLMHQPLLFNGQPMAIYAKKLSISSIAKSLNTTESIIKRMIKLYNNGGEDAIKEAKWGRGGQQIPSQIISDNQKEWATSDILLR